MFKVVTFAIWFAALALHPLMSYGMQTYLPPTSSLLLSKSNGKRPLVGIKVVKLPRAIAAPALYAGLTAFGADVDRFMSPHIPDTTVSLPRMSTFDTT